MADDQRFEVSGHGLVKIRGAIFGRDELSLIGRYCNDDFFGDYDPCWNESCTTQVLGEQFRIQLTNGKGFCSFLFFFFKNNGFPLVWDCERGPRIPSTREISPFEFYLFLFELTQHLSDYPLEQRVQRVREIRRSDRKYIDFLVGTRLERSGVEYSNEDLVHMTAFPRLPSKSSEERYYKLFVSPNFVPETQLPSELCSLIVSFVNLDQDWRYGRPVTRGQIDALMEKCEFDGYEEVSIEGLLENCFFFFSVVSENINVDEMFQKVLCHCVETLYHPFRHQVESRPKRKCHVQ
jgi:hypothetical protein